MTETFFTDPKARKAHKCDLCYRTIDIGEIYHRQFRVDGGEHWTWRECAHCHAVITTLSNTRWLNEIMWDGSYEPENLFDFLRDSGNITFLRYAVGIHWQWRHYYNNELMPISEIAPIRCIDCSALVDTSYGTTLWCNECDEKRIARLNKQFEAISQEFNRYA